MKTHSTESSTRAPPDHTFLDVTGPSALAFQVKILRQEDSNLHSLLNRQVDYLYRIPKQAAQTDKSTQRESNPHVRHGKAIGYRYIMGACQNLKGMSSKQAGIRSTLYFLSPTL